MILKNLFQLYTLLVCLICTIILIITTAFFLNGITDLIIPQYTNYSSLIRYDSRESYMNYLEGKNMDNKQFLKAVGPSPAQIDEKRAFDRQQFLEVRKGSAIQSLINTVEWAFIALIFFFIHWRLYKRSKENS